MGATQPQRLEVGGAIDRSRLVELVVDGTTVMGFAGDTVASALVANGALRVGNSIYRGRPRGILSAGVEEPNAFVLVKGEHDESMLPATTLELVSGLDLRLLDGIGVLDQKPDPAEYDKMHVHTDVAVVGAGPAGLAAAREAAATGARVVLFEQDFALGGSLLAQPDDLVEGLPAAQWVERVRAELEAAPEVTVLTRTTAFGSYDSNHVVAVEKRAEHLHGTAGDGVSRQRIWHVTAGQLVLATGAFERPIVFADNDVPGIMLASAVVGYIGRYAALPGRDAVVFTTNDSGYAAAHALVRAGATVQVVDARDGGPGERVAAAATAAGLTVRTGSAVVGVDGDVAVEAAWIARIDADGALVGDAERVPCDLVAVSGGWTPNVSLHSQRQGALHWDDDLAGFVPTAPVRDQHLAGAVRGTYWTEGCLVEGAAVGQTAAAAVGFTREDGCAATDLDVAAVDEERAARAGRTRQLWLVESREGGYATHFVDLQRDNTAADVLRATGAGMRSVEHVKRYTSISTGVDQGRIGAVNAIGLLTRLLTGDDARAIPPGQPGQDERVGAPGSAPDGIPAGGAPRPTPGAIGNTTFRAPFTPVAFVALAGRSRGELFDAARTTPVHPWHVDHGARFEDVGQWKRPWYYPRPGEDMDAAVARECRAAREGVAFMDATTLGKIEIRGGDAGEFLNRVYTNAFKKLAVGKARYGVMCKPDGMVFDDGVVLRLAEDRYFATTTTGGAARVLEWLEEWSQTEWPELDVVCTSVTEQWATVAVVGPRSRDVIARLAPDLDVSKEAFGFMEFRETVLASGIPARICRITFSGELAFEINVPTWFGLTVWEDVAAAGADFDITPYGTETMHVLRAEKAYPIVGQDTDGTVTPQDLGMDWIVSTTKDFIGKRSYSRASHQGAGRKQLVSVLPVDRSLRLPEGAQLVESGALGDYTGEGLPARPIPMLGHVTSSYHSQALGRSFGLALVKDGRNRIGQTLIASFEGRFAEVEVADAVLYDTEGARRDG
ncbi:sarcosine oxidase subunit alpha [Humibacillus xanthopallidus]|uniref:Sarcosine oxidase subunit alpha n=1 Tax=Humibacillus xanthopallidus TaxID=412689 RepID=A0A543PM23_9MICO|nr:2Fe-2S iron-sulfur cluster-binding protein [Humibacillus xanthopallidus]TQN45133.1 sarcosine oxidase subunit alpha [Humibacillus xanthopallidus]